MADSTDVEPLLPTVSLRSLIGLVTVCSLSMAVVQQAFTNQQTWAVLLTVVIAAVVIPILVYVATFSLASLFATLGSAAATGRWDGGGWAAAPQQHQPTAEMPSDPTFIETSVSELANGEITGGESQR